MYEENTVSLQKNKDNENHLRRPRPDLQPSMDLRCLSCTMHSRKEEDGDYLL